MAAPVISIFSDSSEESVGSHAPRVILFGPIPAISFVIPKVHADPLAVPEVGGVSVISPVEVLDLVDYSSFDFDPSKDSLPLASELPLVSPFLCFDDSEADNESEPTEQRPKRHESLIDHDAILSRIRRRPTTLIRPGKAIPFGRPYRTHPNGPHSSSSGSSSDSSSVHSSRFDASESSPDSSSKRSLDSSLHSAGPSRKRCRSLTTLDNKEEHMEIGTANAEAVANLGISDRARAHNEDGIGIAVKNTASDVRDNKENFEAEASAGVTVEVKIDPRAGLVVEVDIPNHVTADGAVEITYETLGYLVQRFHDHTEEIPVH
uniref:Uncharacterized protein n=1 Tax=Tanacetum cinerariifolium TaxID=118510 RepID=A0A6L2MGB1_TANCI|nr:hypothetical protein [Tanacetum cinerariifolium]